MTIQNADLLDVVRRLRTYITTLDNVHSTLNAAIKSDDQQLVDMANELMGLTPGVATKVSMLLRRIESSRAYRDIIKSYNMEE